MVLDHILTGGQMEEEIVVSTTAFKADNQEHMAMYAINRGFKARRRRGTDPFDTTGVQASIRVSFGDLHYQFEFTEFCEGVKPPEQRRRRR